MTTVILCENILEPTAWERHEVEDVRDFLMSRFSQFPSTARIYQGQVAEANDVTPSDEAGVVRLGELPGPLYVVVYPADPVTAVIAVVAILAAAALSFLIAPATPSVTIRNRRNESPNNELSERTNRSRVNSRIPDIYGTVRSTPDLLAVPYRVFENHEEIEHAYMCVGRGSYDIPAEEIRDGDTRVQDIAGTSIEVYGPVSSPNSGGDPVQLRIGTAIGEDVYQVGRSNSVNGQVLRPPNVNSFAGSNDITFVYPDEIQGKSGEDIDFTDYFQSGDTLIIDWSTVTDPSAEDLSGTYTILSVSSLSIILSDPASVNAEWGDSTNFPITDVSPILETTGPKWVGPFTLDMVDRVFTNFVALNGLFKDDGTRQRRMDVELELELTPVDNTGTPTGSAETFTVTVEGSETTQSTRAATLKAEPTFSGRASVRARRLTETDLDFNGSVIDEVKWRDLYSVREVDLDDFGDVTTVQALTFATGGALAVKERKLNMLVTREVPVRTSGTSFTAAQATNRAADILVAVATDPFVGNRNLSELDLDNIYDTLDEVEDYFGDTRAGEFCYTFDDDNLSLEETVATIAQAVFCTAYRQGSQIRLKFERATEDSALLFNHRNKLPGTETRTVRFGNQGEHDGVEYTWTDPEDDAQVVLYVPEDQSATNPRQIESVGVRNLLQAFQHAHRAWQKVRHQNTTVDFEATQEAELLVISDRVLVADNTRPETQDGEVLSQDGLELELSQSVEFEAGVDHTIFLQHIDGSVEALGVSAGSDSRHVVLDQAPRAALSLDSANFARATFQIVPSLDGDSSAFLMIERESLDRMTASLRVINYDPSYYQQDSLALWVNDGIEDVSGHQRSLTARGSVSKGAGDPERGTHYLSPNNSSYLDAPTLTAPADYTKALWTDKDDMNLGHLLSSVGDDERFFMTGTGAITASHRDSGGTLHSLTASGAPDGGQGWNHVAVTYDAASTTMRLFLNGAQVAEDTAMPQRTQGALQVGARNGASAHVGKLDDVRLYNRALSNNEIRLLYQRTDMS